MKQLLIFIAIVLSFASSAQKYQPALLYGKEENRLRVKTNLGIPDSRYTVPDDQKGYPHICREADVTYYWSPASQLWVAESGSGGSGLNNYPTSFGWNTSTGNLTLARSGLSTLSQNLDGRYLTIADAGTYYYDKTTADGRFAPIVHTHVTGDIIGLATYVRNLFSAGSGLLYDAATGQFSYPGSGGGITSLNGLTDGVQTLGAGTSGTDFNISSVGSAHTFNLPTVSGTARGLVTSTLFNTWNAKQGPITLTNIGSSGPSTFDGTTLNIPNYVGGVTTVFGRSGVVVATSGDYNTDQVTEGSVNKYFTDARARAALSLTTTGSGAATYNNATGELNIPVTSGADGNNYTTAVGFNTATGDLTLDRSGLSTLSKNLDGRYALLANAATNENYLASPGVVTWSGTGLAFDVTPAVYYINGVQYTSNAGSVTLDAADPTNPRIDVIAVDNTGAIVKLTGTPAVNPVKPQIDPTTQVELTFIPVDAGATTPTGVSTTVIYDENVEWSLVPQGITIDANNATSFNGTKAISTSSWSNLNQLTFVNGSALQPANYVTFKMYVRLKSTLSNSANIMVTLANGSTVVSNEVFATAYGMSKSIVGSYQNISIPFSAFNPTGTFDRVRVRFAGSNSNGVYIDFVQLQNGVVPPPPSALQSAYAQMTDGTNTSQSSGSDKFKFRSSDATVTATVTNNDATHGDNVNLTVNGANVTGVPQSGVTGLVSALAAKEDVANKSTSTALGTSNTLYPTQNAVKAYVDAAIAAGGGYTDEMAQDAIGVMTSSEFTYTDATPSLAINTIAQSKVTGLSASLAAKQDALTLTTTGTGAATLTGATLNIPTPAGGSSYTFEKGLTNNSGAVMLGQAPVTATDASYTLLANDFFIILPDGITATRSLIMSNPATYPGRTLVVWNKNTSTSFLWQFNTFIPIETNGTTNSTMNSASVYYLRSDGVNWLREDPSAISKGGTTTLTSDVTLAAGTTNEVAINGNQAATYTFQVTNSNATGNGISSNVGSGNGTAIQGTGTTGTGVRGTSTTGTAVSGQASSTGGVGVEGRSDAGYGVVAYQFSSSGLGLNNIRRVLNIQRFSGGTAATGFGTGIDFNIENASNSGAIANSIDSYWKDATSGAAIPSLRFSGAYKSTGAVNMEEIIPGGAQTTGATSATIDVPIDDETVGIIEVSVTGKVSTTSGGIVGKKILSYRKDGGVLTLGSTTTILADDITGTATGASYTITTSSNNVIITVNGTTGNTFTWRTATKLQVVN